MIFYKCRVALTEVNQSIEHIIPQGIGGRLVSARLLCKTCNNWYGGNIDSVLSKQFESFTAYLAIERERSKDLPVLKNLQTEDGVQYHLKDGRNPVMVKPEIKRTENGFRIAARDKAQILQIIKGPNRNEPRLDDTDLDSKMVSRNEYMTKPLTTYVEAGGLELFRAVAKTGLNFYLFKGGESRSIAGILELEQSLTGKRYSSLVTITWSKTLISW